MRQFLDHSNFKTDLWLDSTHCVSEEGGQTNLVLSRVQVLAPPFTHMLCDVSGHVDG